MSPEDRQKIQSVIDELRKEKQIYHVSSLMNAICGRFADKLRDILAENAPEDPQSKMDFYVQFGLQRENYPGQYAPEVWSCWDEFSIEDNPKGWNNEIEGNKRTAGGDVILKIIKIQVPQEEIRKQLVEDPVISGKIV